MEHAEVRENKMPYPNENVVNAIFESYLSLRKTQWGTEDKDGKLTPPEKESDAAHKTEICSKILQPVSGYLNQSGWLTLIDTIYHQEKAEKEYIDSLMFYRRWFGSQLLLETLKATRSYIIATYKDSSAYQEHMVKLQKEKRDAGIIYNSVRNLPESNKPEDIEKAKKRYEDATEALKPFDIDEIMREEKDHIHFFQNNILGHDPLAAELKEKTFDDFVQNAMDYKRRKNLCTQLLDNARASSDTENDTFKAPEPIKIAPIPVQPKIIEVTKTAPVVNPIIAPPAATQRRRSTRHKEKEESSLRTHSTFAAPASTTTHRNTKNSKKTSSRHYDDDKSSSDEEFFMPKSSVIKNSNW
jgi:hypothetical protein